MIDVKAAREAYNGATIDDIIWIRLKVNIADAMKKATILPDFVEALGKNQLQYEIEQSVKRTTYSQTSEKQKL